MSTETLTHWKKNIDANFIAGEDLQSEVKGLKKEMIVYIEHFGDAEAFDNKANAKKTVTGLYLVDAVTKAKLYKPVVLNKTNARFFINMTKSEFMEHWINKLVVLYACPDKRFGFVVRFKEYIAPPKSKPEPAIEKLNAATDKDTLGKIWSESLTAEERKLPAVLAHKNKLKETL